MISRTKLLSSRQHLLRHGDALSIDEGQHFIVVHDRVHALDPQCVHRAIEKDPFLIWLLILTQAVDEGTNRETSLSPTPSSLSPSPPLSFRVFQLFLGIFHLCWCSLCPGSPLSRELLTSLLAHPTHWVPAHAARMTLDKMPSVHSLVLRSYSPYSSPKDSAFGFKGNS